MKITKANFAETFRAVFAKKFEELGFRQRTETNFVRHRPGVEHRIGFNVLDPDRNGVFRMVSGVGVRLEAIENLIRSGDEFASVATIGKPLHLLRPDQQYQPWAFAQRAELETLAPQIMSDVRQYAVPFLERYGDYDSVFSSLRSDQPKDWFMATSDTRDTLLVADAFIKFGQAEASAFGRKLLNAYEGKLPKYSRSLRELLDKIEKLRPLSVPPPR
jgi:hypothetical protein